MGNSTVTKFYLNKDGSATIFYMGQDGKLNEEKCDNPKTCSKHASLFKGQPAAFPEFDDKVEVDDETFDYGSYALQELYDNLTIGKPSNTPANPYTTGPKDSPARCKECNEEIEIRTMKWSNELYNGTEMVWVHKNKPELDYFSNGSLNNNLQIPNENYPTKPRHYAKRPDWCPQCGTLESLKLDQQAWADVITCTASGCDFYRRYSIGD